MDPEREIACHLCGVSFSTCRLRTASEPITAAWDSCDSSHIGASFCNAELLDLEKCWAGGCAPDSGCMLAFRYDRVIQLHMTHKRRHIDPNPLSDTVDVEKDSWLWEHIMLVRDALTPLDNPSEYIKICPGRGTREKFLHIGDRDFWKVYNKRMPDIIHWHLEKLGFILEDLMFSDVMTRAFEHISGSSSCRFSEEQRLGYSGHRISFKEASMCSIAQCLMPLQHTSSDVVRQSRSDDEVWERHMDNRWGLSGLCLEISHCTPSFDFPRRQGRRPRAIAKASPDTLREDSCMAFHPTCFEIFKRVALHKLGKFDPNDLGRWFLATANFTLNRVPRHYAVWYAVLDRRAILDGTWSHYKGDEWLVANPCYVPNLEHVFQNAYLQAQGRRDLTGFAGLQSLEARTNDKTCCSIVDMPVELAHQIFNALDDEDVANLTSVWPVLTRMANVYLYRRIRREKPYLWDLWSQSPYSKWTMVTPIEFWNIVDGDPFSRLDHRTHLVNGELPALDFKAMNKPIPQAIHETLSNEGMVDFVRFLRRAKKEGQLAGLKNRKRIWKACECIVDQIQKLKLTLPDDDWDVEQRRRDGRRWTDEDSDRIEKILYG